MCRGHIGAGGLLTGVVSPGELTGLTAVPQALPSPLPPQSDGTPSGFPLGNGLFPKRDFSCTSDNDTVALFIHSLNKHRLYTYFVPGTVGCSRDTELLSLL